MLLPSPLFCWWKSQSPSQSLCLSRGPELSPWMDWSCSPGCCHAVTEPIPVTVRVSLSCCLSSDKQETSHAVPPRFSCCSVQDAHHRPTRKPKSGLLSAAWAAGGGKGVWEMLSPSLCKRKQDPKGRNDALFGWLLRRGSFPSCQKLCLVIWRCFSWCSITEESLSSSSWAAPGHTSQTWSCQLSLGNAALFAWGSSCGGAEPSNSFRELGGPWKGLKGLKLIVQWEK